MRLSTRGTNVAADGGAEAKPSTSAKQELVRVWWPPSRDPSRTGFCGAYWPARVVRKGGKGKENTFTVEYDNGEQEVVDVAHIFPPDPPVDFGEEPEIAPLEVCVPHRLAGGLGTACTRIFAHISRHGGALGRRSALLEPDAASATRPSRHRFMSDPPSIVLLGSGAAVAIFMLVLRRPGACRAPHVGCSRRSPGPPAWAPMHPAPPLRLRCRRLVSSWRSSTDPKPVRPAGARMGPFACTPQHARQHCLPSVNRS